MEWQVDRMALMEKFPGKGGWTYIPIPEIPQDPKAPFGWVVVSGYIDQVEILQQKAMPMGNGQLFFSVKKALRKALNKEAGDQVYLKLKRDENPFQVPGEIVLCLEQEDPQIRQRFEALAPSSQKAWTDHIMDAKTDKTRVERIVKLLELL